jgi:hypothetical protein
MKKVVVAIGIVILVLGILLTAFTFIAIPENKTEAYQVPKSTVLIDRFGPILDFNPVPTTNWADGFTFSAGDFLNIQVNVTSGQRIDFYVSDGSNGLSSNVGSSPYLSYPNVTLLNTDWVVHRNSSYNFVFSSSSTFSPNDVHWQIEKLWNETDYRDVTKNVPLIPFELSYVGVVLSLAGIGLLVYLKKRKH